MGAHQNEGFVGLFCDRLPRLAADGVQAGGDMAEGGDEGAIGGTDPQMPSVSG
jgi:hypothetical protein